MAPPGGRRPAARVALEAAIESDPHVPGYLLGDAKMPASLPPFLSPGEPDEAVCVFEGGAEWKRTPGALDWLRRRTRSTLPASEDKGRRGS